MNVTRDLCLFALGALALACNPRPPGRCKVQQECREGSFCSDGICLPAGAPGTCSPTCPDDFACRKQVCVAAFDPEARVLAPAEGAFVGPTGVPVRAAVKAPGGIAAVVIKLVRDGHTLARAEAEPFGQEWAASLDVAPEEVSEGAAGLVAVVRYGPEGGYEHGSAAVNVVVDRTPPEVIAVPDAAWHREPFTVAADVSDALSGVDPETVALAVGLAEVKGVQGERAGYTFAVDAAAASPGAEGELAYEIRARDRVGNERRAPGPDALRLDLAGPAIVPVPDPAWHSRGEAAEVSADVADRGSGLAGAWLAGAAGSEEGEGRVRFTAALDEVAPEGVEGPVELEITAEDALGNRSAATATLLVDGRPPSVEVVPDASWYARTGTAVVRVTGTDAGSGLKGASFNAASGPALQRGAVDGVVEIAVPLAGYVPADHEGPFSFRVTAWDAVGNAAEVEGTLQVDGRAPQIAFTQDGAWHAREETVTVGALVADAGSGLDGAAVRLRAGGRAYSGAAGSGVFAFTVPLAEVAAAGTEGGVAFAIEARDLRGNVRTTGGQWHVDDRAPALSFTWVQSPLRRDSSGNVVARAVDRGAGVEAPAVRLSAPGMAKVEAVATGNADEFQVVWDAARPTFRMVEGQVTLTLEAADRLGHAASITAPVTITRRLFVYEKPSAGAITSSPAVAGARVYFGSEDFRAYALDRRSGAKVWEFATGGRVTASPAVGAERVYLASEDGHVYAVERDGTEAWRCPGSSTLGTLSSSPAIGATDGEETVFVASSSSRATYAMRGSGFMLDPAIPEVKACLRSIARGGGGRSSVALDGAGGVYAGEASATGGRLVKLAFAKSGEGVWGFSAEWAFAAADLVHSSPALRATGSVLFGADDRRVYEVAAGEAVWSAVALGRVSGSPSIGAQTSYVIDEAGRAFALRLADGSTAWESAVADSAVRTTPALGEDGALYIAAGTKLSARAADGALLWEYDAGGPVDGSSPALACDGALYFGAGGKLHVLVTDSRGLAPSAWPRFRHDNRNTGNAATPVRSGGACVE